MWVMSVMLRSAEWTLVLSVYIDAMCKVDCAAICNVRLYRVEQVTECLCYCTEWTMLLRV